MESSLLTHGNSKWETHCFRSPASQRATSTRRGTSSILPGCPLARFPEKPIFIPMICSSRQERECAHTAKKKFSFQAMPSRFTATDDCRFLKQETPRLHLWAQRMPRGGESPDIGS